MRRATSLSLLVAASLVIGVAGQEQTTFRSGVDVIQVDVVVTDEDGNPVTDLTADDFEVFEDDRRQTVATLSLVDIPIERAARVSPGIDRPAPDVQSNALAGDRRLYTIVMGAFAPSDGMKARHVLRQFIEQRFQEGDIGALVYMGQTPRGNAQSFTGNRRLLLNAVDSIVLGGQMGTRPLRTFGNILEAVARIDARRKTVLLVSSGFSDVFDIIDNVGGVKSIEQDELREAIAVATRANVAIYTIDPSGLTADLGGNPDALTAESAPNLDSIWNGGRSALSRQQSLRTIAWLTGGFGLTNSNNFEDALERIVRETSTYYLLGYYPTDQRQDGRFRRLTVRVKRPGLEVRSRIGYVAPKPEQERRAPRPALVATESAGLRRAIGSPITANGLPLRVTAAPFRGTKDQAVVALAVHVDATQLGLMEDSNRFVGELEIGHLATNEQNRVVPGEFHVAKLQYTPDRHRRALERGVLVLTEARLRPGRYQLRVAATNRMSASGSVVYDLDVPDFTKTPLALSGVVLTDRADDRPIVPHKTPLDGIAPGTPTTVREFTTADTITTFVAVYDNDRSSSHTVTTTSRLRTLDGQTVRTVSDHVASADLQNAEHRVTASFPLTGLAPGEYVIDIESRSSAKPDVVARRAVPIRIQ